MKEKIKKEQNIVELTLSNGINVKFNPADANGHLLMKCRKVANEGETVIYLLSEIATFDGEKMPAPEILNFSAFDIIKLESAWGETFQG